MYITNRTGEIRLPNEPGLLAWLQDTYPYSQYHIVNDQ
jgi:hypothetical protein